MRVSKKLRKKRKNLNAFTLIELLVCITILGIITAMSIPIIRNITVKNSSTKYSSYLDTVVNAAKLYVDSYGDDMFGHHEVGCSYVSFQDLKDKNLVKDYNENGITCDTESTFVQVTKFEDSYSFVGYLGCANKDEPATLIYTLPNNGTPNVQDSATCAGIDTSTTIGVTVSPSSFDGTTGGNTNVKIKVSGRAGMKRDFQIKYKWSTSNLDITTDGMQTATFNSIPTEAAQRENLLNGNIITTESVAISTPLGESGDLFFILYSDNLRDLYDTYWIYNDSSYMVFGPYSIDNTPPEFSPTSEVVSSVVSYNMNIPKLSINVTDDFTSTSNLEMCVSYDNYCTDWERYNGSKVLEPIVGFEYNGSTYDVYVAVKDAAGNESRRQFIYKSYVKCSETVDDGDWIGDCPSCGTNVSITQTKKTKDAYLGVQCSNKSRQYTCNNVSGCCTDKKMVCSAWSEYGACSRACAGGTMRRTRTCNYVSNIDGSSCGTVTDSTYLVQVAECGNINCAPTICVEDGNKYVSSTPGESFVYPVYECDTLDRFAPSRTCTIQYPSGSSQRCIAMNSYVIIDGVPPELFNKVGNGQWYKSGFTGWSASGPYDVYLQNRAGVNYSAHGATSFYKILKSKN